MSRPHSQHHYGVSRTSYNERSHPSTHTTRSPQDHTQTTYDQFLIKKSAKSSKSKHHWGLFKKATPQETSHEQRPVTKHAITKSSKWDKTVYCKALYDFHGDMPCDLYFKKGQRIAIVTRTETQDDWWEGTVNGKTGIFPANYVSL